MRNGQNKRMRGRNRNHKSHHGGGGGGGGGGHHHNPLTRVYESNGPEVKIRGTAHHIAEKYLQLARDAHQPPYPPREQPHPYGGQPPNSTYQGRPQHPPQQHQPYSPPPQPYQPQPAQPAAGAGDAGQLPSFITGAQPQQSAPNGYDN